MTQRFAFSRFRVTLEMLRCASRAATLLARHQTVRAWRGGGGLALEQHELRSPDFAKLRDRMRGNALFDGRNQWSPDAARREGFIYRGFGRR